MLWVNQNTPRTTSKDSPFRSAYGTDALITVEIGSPSLRVKTFDEVYNEQDLRENLDLVEDISEAAVQHLSIYQQRTTSHYIKHLKNLKILGCGSGPKITAEALTPQDIGNLKPTWEGPYEVVEVLKLVTYTICHMNGDVIPNFWHAARLRRYYQLDSRVYDICW